MRIEIRSRLDWTKNDRVLQEGELVCESNTLRLKIGDGKTRYSSLPFATAGTSGISEAAIMDGGGP